MITRLILVCLVASSSIVTMDKPGQKLTVEEAKEVVKEYVTKKEGSYIKQQQESLKEVIKSSNYFKSSTPGVVALPPVAIEQEINAALVDIFEDNGYVCADNKVFVVAFDKDAGRYKVINFLNLTGKVEQTDHSQPAIASMKVTRLKGAEGPRILLGELKGRLLIADASSHVINSFGEMKGKITEIIPHPAGTHLAVKYLQDSFDDIRKKNPCIAACRAYLAFQSSQKRTGSYLQAQNVPGNRRSWLPQGYVWSQLVTKECVNGIDAIRWENENIQVQCSLSKKWEVYKVENDALVEIETYVP